MLLGKFFFSMCDFYLEGRGTLLLSWTYKMHYCKGEQYWFSYRQNHTHTDRHLVTFLKSIRMLVKVADSDYDVKKNNQ